MEQLPRFRHLVGYRNDRLCQSLNDYKQLQDLFVLSIPDHIGEFLIALKDSILYYRYEIMSRTGKPKPYSHFVMTNIGPEVGVHPFPASIIGRLLRYRGMGLPDGYMPLMLDMGKNSWLWFDLHRLAVVVPKGDRQFGVSEREWNVIAPSFDAFIGGMELDLSPHFHAFRLAGFGNVQPSMRNWFVAVLGDDWEAQVQDLIKRKKK